MESQIVDNSVFDQKADIAPGIYDNSIFDKPEIKAEETPLTLKQKISKGAEYLPTAGALVGGGLSALAAPGTMGASLIGGSALAGLGAAAGKAGEQLIKRAVGDETPTTATGAAKEIGKEGAWTAALNATFAKIIPLLKPAAQKLMPDLMKAFQGIDAKVGAKVINDPDILFRAKPMTVAKKEFAEFFEKNGFVYGPKSVKAATGKLALSDQAADDLISNVVGKIESVSGTTTGKSTGVALEKLPENKDFMENLTQEALAARFAIKDAVKRAFRSGNESKGIMFLEARNQVDNWLEKQISGFANVRKMYEEAKILRTFSDFFPRNLNNRDISYIRQISAMAAGTFNPALTVGAAPVVSKKIIEAGAIAASKPVIAEAAQLTGSAINESIENEKEK